MTDIFTPEKRSWIMFRIRGTNTGIDRKMKSLLDCLGFPFLMYPKMFGNPDFILTKQKIVIFCDGDFWHGYRYDKKKKPVKKFWRDKIERNMARDKRISRKLRRDGWSVLRMWEHDIDRRMDFCINKILGKVFEKT
ncbi:MAG: very short patch repair endonuclease [Nitrosopumilus sp.]|nr:very short patch repair endonuclease [Nitrosopumilus sp.]